MRSNYERNRFTIVYWIGVCLYSIASFIISVVLFRGFDVKWLALFGVSLIALFIIYICVYHHINQMCCDVESVSNMMIEVMNRDYEIEQSDYKEGSIGILYSNFEKMVCALQLSRQKEMDEKIFLRDIISDISHQLKTPLASLNVFMDLLVDDKVTDETKKRQMLIESQNQLSRMEWMVLSMLKLARIEAGAIVFEQKKQSLYPCLMQAREGVLFLTKERQQKLSIFCDEKCEFTFDADWLVEAIINLLKNASDYSGEGKPITVEVEQTAIYTRIYVKDEGPGIAESEMSNIFKRFYRVNQEVNPNSVGIGLSLTKSIVEGMGGSIHVQSEVSKYTWFVITFVE